MRTGACALLLLLLVGCDDAVTDAAIEDAGRTVGDGAVDGELTLWDAGPPDAAPLLGDAGAPCEVVDARRCPVEGEGVVWVCDGTRWLSAACPEGERCLGEQCRAPDEACVPGDGTCLAGGIPARCDQEGVWHARAVCDGERVCAAGRCVPPACTGAVQTRSYVGCSYLAVDLPSHRYLGPGGDSVNAAPLGLIVHAPQGEETTRLWLDSPGGLTHLPRYEISPPDDDDLSGDRYAPRTLTTRVQDADGMVVLDEIGVIDGLEIPPGGMATLLLPRTGVPNQRSEVQAVGWKVRSDRPVVAYQFSPLCCNYAFSNDASLLLPVSALGTRYRHLGVPTQGGIPGGLTVVAAEETQVTIRLPEGARIALDPDGRVVSNGGVISVLLAPLEALSLQSAIGAVPPESKDLTGAIIESDAPVAVFSGHQCANIPSVLPACDHLEEQIFPVDAWGAGFVLAPPVRRSEDEVETEVVYWKVVADRDETRLAFSLPFADLSALPPSAAGITDCAALLTGPSSFGLEAGESCEFGSRTPVALQASAPVLVQGIISGQGSTGVSAPHGAQAGDPALFLVSPDRQYRTSYAFLTPDTYASNYATIVTHPDASVVLDGAPATLFDGVPIAGTPRWVFQVALEPGAHQIEADLPFGLVVYAYDDFVAYAFTGGLNLGKE